MRLHGEMVVYLILSMLMALVMSAGIQGGWMRDTVLRCGKGIVCLDLGIETTVETLR